jgi:2-methylcitrate dehydratase
LLAAEGMTGPAPIFEGDLGLMRPGHPRSSLPSRPMGGEPGNADDFMIRKTYIKFWPAEYHSQSAIDAALQLRQQLNGEVERIARLDIYTFDACYDIIGKYPQAWAPSTRENRRPQLALLHGGGPSRWRCDPWPPSSQPRFTEPKLLALTAKIKVHRDAHLNTRYPTPASRIGWC